MNDDDATLRDDEWDTRYFDLISELTEKYASRYEVQTDELLRKRLLKIEFNGANIEFKLTPKGCWFYTDNPQCRRSTSSWRRMGWGKSTKRRSLPNYFAEAEAIIILDQMG